MIKLYALRWAPPMVHGLVRDLRVRWALEEAGIPYEEVLVGQDDLRSASYRMLQPFGQAPAIEEDGRKLFESGAIVMHLAERSDALMPRDPDGRARMHAWMFAALNSLEPAIINLAQLDLRHRNEDWAKLRRPELLELVTNRLTALSAWLGDRDHLEDRFTAGDLLVTTVLRILRHTELVAQFPNLEAYRKRCEARPAFQRALEAQLAALAKNAPPENA